MRRRRLFVVAGILALVITLATWSVFDDRLTAEEQRLVGTWVCADPLTGQPEYAMRFTADRRFHAGPLPLGGLPSPDQPPCRWALHGGTIILDEEQSAFRRLARPLAGFLNVQAGPSSTVSATITADSVVTTNPERKFWTRIPAD